MHTQKDASVVQKNSNRPLYPVPYSAVRIWVSLSGRANLVWACDDVVAYFASSGRFQPTAWQRNENIKLWTLFFHLGSKGHDLQVGEQINI